MVSPFGVSPGVCDGVSQCVDPIENPCVQHGCSGKQCGDGCFSGDIRGRCDANGACEILPIDLQCGTLTLRILTLQWGLLFVLFSGFYLLTI